MEFGAKRGSIAAMDTTPLSALPNLGPKSAALLAQIGILDAAQLRACGAVDAFVRLKRAGQPASLNLLWAMEAALTDGDWRQVAKTERLRLLTEVEARGVAP